MRVLVVEDDNKIAEFVMSGLKQAGLVEDRREGVMAFYRVKVCCLAGFWKCIETVLSANLKAYQEALR